MISSPSSPSGWWGPQPQPPPATPHYGRRLALLLLALAALSSGRILLIVLVCGVAVTAWRLGRRASDARSPDQALPAADGDVLSGVLAESHRLGGGVYVGATDDGGWRLSRPERGVLVLGPPRSGKTSSIIVPALLAHDGPAVSTSTKADVLTAAGGSRSRMGRVWRFDPCGTATADADQISQLRWSPVACSREWDGALLMARAMVLGAGVGQGTTDATHWSRRAQALLAPLLHAAALSELGIDRVHGWVLQHDLDTPGMVLQSAGAELAAGIVIGLQNTEARERSSILSAAADALDAYSSTSSLAAATDPNFDAQEFVHSTDTIFVHAPAELQQLAAPLVCGLLSEIRAATYRAHAAGELHGRVLFALDEVANIAPVNELPAMAAEGGGQGLQLLAALQDLSQARARWGPAAEGFLTLFGGKLILPGIADQHTLETVSVALGEYDRQVLSTTRTRTPQSFLPHHGHTLSIQRQRILSPGEIANIPPGRALYLDGVAWELLQLTPAHVTEPWRTLSAGSLR
jgi:type IV secretory pathway TraG/TraD family ATPase VirD4